MLHIIPSHQGRSADDPIFALNAEATARRQRGESIVNGTVGALLHDDGRLAVLPTAALTIQNAPEGDWAPYAPIAGAKEFLQAVILDLFRDEPEMRGCAVAAATPGGTGALRHAIVNFLEPGQSILTTGYFWGPYATICEEADRKVATFSMFGEDGSIDVAALDRGVARQIVEQKRVLLVLNDPCHNPTGYSMRLEEWRTVVECLLRHARSSQAPISLLVDMAYWAYGAMDSRAFLKELRPLLGEVGLVFAWSASKTFTHYGLRVGAIIACFPDPAERASTEAALAYSCRGTWSNCTRGGMRAIARLLSEPDLSAACDRERAELRALLSTRVAAFNDLAPKHALRYPRYEGGFFVTVFADDSFERAVRMREKGVFVLPQKGTLRVALCSVAASEVARLVDALAS